jgi:2-iminobutanoate/2-iminopropanoate deaminase
MELIQTDAAPAAIGPYSQAVRVGGMVYCSGQLPLDPVSGRMVEGDVGEQARMVLANLRAVLEAAGSGMDKVAKTTVYLMDMADFPVVNREYGEAFGGHRPARATVQVAGLPLGARVEIECVALVG